MIRVLIIPQASEEKNGGIERHCRNLIDLLKTSKIIEPIGLPEIPIIHNKIIRKSWYDRKGLENAILRSNCDVIHLHGFISPSIPQVIEIAKKHGIDTVYSPHFHPFKYLDRPFFGRLFFDMFLKRKLKFLKHIVTISEIDKEFFKKYNLNVTSIPHNYRINSSNTYRNQINQKEGLLFVGRNANNKGLDLLYQLPGYYKVSCVTKGPLKRSDFTLYESVSDDELEKLYQQSEVVVIPSRYEAFSYVALEALMNGTPIVISDRVEIAFYLNDNPAVGIFNYGDIYDLISKIEKVKKQDVDIKKIQSIFSPKIVKEKYEEVYKLTVKENDWL